MSVFYYLPDKNKEEMEKKIKEISPSLLVPTLLGGAAGMGMSLYNREAYPLSLTLPSGIIAGLLSGILYNKLKKNSSLETFYFISNLLKN